MRSHLRDLGAYLVQRLLPPEDASSPTGVALLKELMATSVLEPIVESLSDPDRINQWICAALRKPTEGKSMQGATSLTRDSSRDSLIDRTSTGEQIYVKGNK